ncbi:MAG TPA: cytochrome d ubiquinol oxidase subunit II [Rubrobacteraceae bacterium]|nr:cytochrome d ubiquinol oxidase subunit II [Rubrobacteraceae bacterium]
MPFDVILAGALGASILLFALAGGADFGAGFWSLLARRGERATEQQQLIERSIGPLWEANELWIVVSAVILWSAFTPAFAAYGTALFVPFVLAIAGVLLRGAFLAFRIEAQEEAPRAYRFFGEIFGSMSIITPFFLGTAAGAIASGRLRLNENELPVDGYFQPWLGPFPIIVGILGVVTCTYLSAIYLTIDAADNEPLQEDFRLRGIISGVTLGVLGVAAIPITRLDAPHMWEGLAPGKPASVLMIVAAAFLVASVVLLFLRRYWFARAAAILQVVSVFCAWAVAQYPYLLVPDITIQDAASPRSVLVAMSILIIAYVVVLGPALYLLFRLFKSSPSGREEEY